MHAQTQTGDTALTYACENGHTDVAEVLLSYSAKLEHESEGGRTPLMKACRAGHICTVKFLINKGAMVNRTTTNNDHTPLSLACAGGHQTVVELLLKSGADPFHRLKDNSTMLIEAAKGGHIDVVRLLLDYPSSVVQVDLGCVPPAALNNAQHQQQHHLQQQQMMMPHDPQQQQQQMLAAPPGLQDVPEAVRANNHQLLHHHQFPQQAKDGNSSSCILKNMSELLNSPPDPILSEIMQMQAGFKDGLALGLNKGQPEMVNHLINNLSNSLVQHQYQLATHQQALQRTMLDPGMLNAAVAAAAQDQEQQDQVQGKLQELLGLRAGKGGQFVVGGGGGNLNICTAEAQQVRSDPLGEEEGGQAYFPQPSGSSSSTEEMQKQEKLLEYQIANYDNTQFKLICDGILPPDLYVDIQAGEQQQQQLRQSHPPDATVAGGPMMPLPAVPVGQQQPLTAPSEVSQDTAISNRPKVKPVSKKDGKKANRQGVAAVAAAAAQALANMPADAVVGEEAQQQQMMMMGHGLSQQQLQHMQECGVGQEVVMLPGAEGLAMVQGMESQLEAQQQMMACQPVGLFDKHFHEHENYLNDLQQQMQFYRQRLEKHQQLQVGYARELYGHF